MRKWNLRFAVTPRCNFRCRYCLPSDFRDYVIEPSAKEILEVLHAAQGIGIQRVHWTGGEPTVRSDFCELVRGAKEVGFTQQIITTNGYRLWRIIDELIENGLTRVIVSLDSLKPTRNEFVTRANYFHDTIKSIEKAVKKLPTLTKISVVTMKSTLPELKDFVSFAQELNAKGYSGEVAFKLNQFFPCNPAQLSVEGQTYWKEEFLEEREILVALSEIGDLRPISRENIEGDNPSYQYYLIGNTGVKVAILALFSWNFPCGGCWKLRISPQGIATICINQQNPPTLWGKSVDEKTKILSDLTSYRESSRLALDYPGRRHYRDQLGELRFGKVVSTPHSIDYFKNLLED